MGKLLEPSQNIERSIMKKYRKELWNPFIKAVKNYELEIGRLQFVYQAERILC